MPLHLGHYSSRNIPTLGLINEVVIRDDGLLRGPLGRPYQQVSYFLLKHFVRRKPYGVAAMPCLQVLVNLRLGKSSVCSKQQPHFQLQVALDDGIDELRPAIGAVDLAWSENRPLASSKLVEAEQGVIAHASKVAVVGCFLLLAMHRTLRTADVQDDTPVYAIG